jgi:tRNA-Thr(GGU) m(6)t(6)A37 methyltransferase TsaA
MRFELTPIGVIRSAYTDKYLAPRQPGVFDADVSAAIELYPGQNFEQALHDLDGIEHIWIISWFDRATSWSPKVLPPRSDRKRGVFSTRAPHRPNPIGLSVARVTRISGRTIEIASTDLLDGTPVLDIKPYVPMYDALPESAAGWIDEVHAPRYVVHFADDVRDVVRGREDMAWVTAHIERVLSHDPYPHPYRRTERVDDDRYVLAVRELRAWYTIDADVVTVYAVTLPE